LFFFQHFQNGAEVAHDDSSVENEKKNSRSLQHFMFENRKTLFFAEQLWSKQSAENKNLHKIKSTFLEHTLLGPKIEQNPF